MALDPRVNLADGAESSLAARVARLEKMMSQAGNATQQGRGTIPRAYGGFGLRPEDRLSMFAAHVLHAPSGGGQGFSVGTFSTIFSGLGTISFVLTQNYRIDTSVVPNLPCWGIGATTLGTTAAYVRVSAWSTNSIEFQTINSSGSLVDESFNFIGIGVLA